MQSPLATRQLLIGSLFPGLSPDLLTWATPRLTRRIRELRLEPGEALFRAGDAATGYYLLIDGTLQIGPRTRTAPDETGWREAILELPRSVDAVAVTSVHAFELAIADFTAVAEDSLDLSMGLLEERARHSRRAAPPDVPLEIAETDPFARTLEILHHSDSMSYARIQPLASLAECAETVRLPAGQALTVGGGALWVVADGAVRACERTYGPGSTVLGPGAFVERAATISATAVRDAELLRIDFDDWFDVAEESFDLVRSVLVWIEEERDA